MLLRVLRDLVGGRKAQAQAEGLRLACEHLARSRTEEAIAVLNELLEREPDSVEGRILRGTAKREMGRLMEAFADLARAVELAPDDHRCLYKLAEVSYLVGDHRLALEYCGRLRRVTPDLDAADVLQAQIRFGGEHYLQVLARILDSVQPRSYVEIGVAQGNSLRLVKPPTLAIGVDPDPQLAGPLAGNHKLFAETSDAFFAGRDPRAELGGLPIDLAFIDGMHHFEVALRDFANLERYSTPDSIILIHDCYPLDRETAERERHRDFWSGDIWRLILLLKKYRPELAVHTIGTAPTGLALVRNLDPGSRFLLERYDRLYEEFLSLDYAYLDDDMAGKLSLFPNDWARIRTLLGKPAQRSETVAPGVTAAAVDAADTQSDAHFNQGNAYKDQGRLEEAIASYEKAVTLAPDFAAAHVNLGSALMRRSRHREALACFQKALVLEPELAEAYFNLGIASYQVGDLASAKAALAKYLQAQPDDRDALMVLGEAYSRSNELDEAAGCLERILAKDPGAANAHNLLANILRNQARHRDAVRHYELAILHGSNPVVAFQNLLFCMLCMGDFSAADIHAKHREFARRFEQPLLSLRPAFRNTPDPGRRLKIGYVSPDFRANVVGYYIQPILENHDRAQFETHCYFTGSIHDGVTERIASLVDRWHDVHLLSDDDLAALVRSHQIDILVDLCGHGGGNRILALARKPAPLQVNYLDYSATTGLSSIDYRLTTEYCDPSGTSEQYYSEKLYRLKGTYWTYNPAVRLPVSALPMKSNGYVTFGSFNLYYRITREVLDLWSRLLLAIPGSRLLIVSVAAGSTQAALLERLQRAGIARDRVSMHGVVSYQTYNELMGTVDIALAPYPYNGATTVMDCLWNGLPVVAKAGGETFSSRLGCSVLAEMGLSELIAADEEEYVRIAVELASAVPRLADLRQTLRRKLECSPMRDFPGFTRGLELAYRSMWKDWCALHPA